MLVRLAFGFVIASLIQAGIIMTGESLNITSLDANLDLLQLFTHVITGIVAGYILFYLTTYIEGFKKDNLFLIGIVYGVILWPIVLGIASSQGKVNSPLNLNIITVLWTLTAFAIYGIIANFTIRNYGKEKIKS